VSGSGRSTGRDAGAPPSVSPAGLRSVSARTGNRARSRTPSLLDWVYALDDLVPVVGRAGGRATDLVRPAADRVSKSVIWTRGDGVWHRSGREKHLAALEAGGIDAKAGKGRIGFTSADNPASLVGSLEQFVKAKRQARITTRTTQSISVPRQPPSPRFSRSIMQDRHYPSVNAEGNGPRSRARGTFIFLWAVARRSPVHWGKHSLFV
jgi:hypothetical protein